ncbi:unnamed protein product, partial [Notodromas monacha]
MTDSHHHKHDPKVIAEASEILHHSSSVCDEKHKSSVQETSVSSVMLVEEQRQARLSLTLPRLTPNKDDARPAWQRLVGPGSRSPTSPTRKGSVPSSSEESSHLEEAGGSTSNNRTTSNEQHTSTPNTSRLHASGSSTQLLSPSLALTLSSTLTNKQTAQTSDHQEVHHVCSTSADTRSSSARRTSTKEAITPRRGSTGGGSMGGGSPVTDRKSSTTSLSSSSTAAATTSMSMSMTRRSSHRNASVQEESSSSFVRPCGCRRRHGSLVPGQNIQQTGRMLHTDGEVACEQEICLAGTEDFQDACMMDSGYEFKSEWHHDKQLSTWDWRQQACYVISADNCKR